MVKVATCYFYIKWKRFKWELYFICYLLIINLNFIKMMDESSYPHVLRFFKVKRWPVTRMEYIFLWYAKLFRLYCLSHCVVFLSSCLAWNFRISIWATTLNIGVEFSVTHIIDSFPFCKKRIILNIACRLSNALSNCEEICGISYSSLF